MTFLPFHNTPLFSTVLSILPEDLPPTLRFLNPYIQSLSHPPRHAVVHSASNNRNFLASFSAHVLKSSRFEHPNSTLISFWASIVTEGVALMLDHAHSARRETQRQHQEDIILFMLPILNNGLSVENVPDLRVACYMIMIVLASKVDLGEGVVIAMMEAVASDWSQTSHAGLICLAVLAEQMQTPSLPKKVFKAAIALQSLDGDLLTIRKQYNVDKLSLGLSLGIISRLEKARDESKLRLLRNLLEARLMDDVSSIVVIKSMISAAQMTASDMNSRFDVQGSLTDLLLRLYDSKNIGKLVQDTLRGSALDLSRSNMSLQRVLSTQDRTPEQGICDLDMKDTDGQPMTEEFDSLTSRIPTKTAYEISFLSSSESYVFESLLLAFLTASPSAVNRQKFSELPVLRKSLAMTEPLFLSFFIRVWCGPCSPDGRAEAIRTIVDYFGKEALTTDVQLLIPYILYALADPSLKVRRAAGDLVLVLASAYSHADAEKKHDEGRSILGREQIYGQGDETKKVAWLSIKDTARFLTDILVPGLEECLFDEGHVSRLLLEKLNSPRHNKGPNTMHNGLKTSQRLAIFHCLCSHVLYTPLYTVKFRLLQTLNQVSKVGSMSRTKLLLPLLVNAIKQDEHYYDRICSREQLEASQLLNCITSVVSPGDREGIQTLKTIIESPNKEAYPSLKSASLHRIQTIWPMMKTELHSSLAKVLLELALSNAGEELDGGKENEVIETLRVLPLSTAVLKSFAEDLPIISSRLQDKPPPSKRRRTGEGQSSESFALDARYLDFAIRKITLVLELVEDSHAGRHPELLRGLFQVVSDLQHSQGYRVTAIDYLMVLAMESMIAIIKGARVCVSCCRHLQRIIGGANICRLPRPSPSTKPTFDLTFSSTASGRRVTPKYAILPCCSYRPLLRSRRI